MQTRRQKGEGTVFKRADGMWVAGIEIPTHDGTRRQRRVYAKDRRTALRKLEILKDEQVRNPRL
jgi:hypothetical protein